MSGTGSVIVGEREELTPPQIVEALDRYIVGQERAKRAVAVAQAVSAAYDKARALGGEDKR